MDFGIDKIADRIISLLADVKCEYAEVRLSAGSAITISLSGEEIDTFTSGDSVGGSVRVLCNGAWSFVSFNNIADTESFIKRGLDIAAGIPVTVKTKIKAAPGVERQLCDRDRHCP